MVPSSGPSAQRSLHPCTRLSTTSHDKSGVSRASATGLGGSLGVRLNFPTPSAAVPFVGIAAGALSFSGGRIFEPTSVGVAASPAVLTDVPMLERAVAKVAALDA